MAWAIILASPPAVRGKAITLAAAIIRSSITEAAASTVAVAASTAVAEAVATEVVAAVATAVVDIIEAVT
jgi:hypothetical protein